MFCATKYRNGCDCLAAFDFLKNITSKYSWSEENEEPENSEPVPREKEDATPKGLYFDTSEISLKDRELEIAMHFARSREYRIMLQEYQKKLKARASDLDRREALIREQELSMEETLENLRKSRMQDLDSREKEVKKQEFESKRRIDAALENLRQYKNAVSETEYKSLDYVKRIDKKEIEIFNSIRKKVDVFEKANADIPESGYDFERIFVNILIGNGYENVSLTKKSKDFGADILAEKDGIKFVVQCKYYSNPVGIEAVQQIYSAKIYYGSHVAVVATNSVFTRSAETLAKEAGVLLWDGEKVAQMKEFATAQQSE